MKRIKQKFNSAIHRHPWALQLVIALGFISIAVGYSLYGSLGTTQAATDLITLTSPSNASSQKFLVGNTVPISWSLATSQTGYAGWTVDIWLIRQEGTGNTASIIKTALPAETEGSGSGIGIYNWTIPTEDGASLMTDPNPYDRRILVKLNQPDGNNVGADFLDNLFAILLYKDLTYLESPVYGLPITLTWETNLTAKADLYLVTWKTDGSAPVYNKVTDDFPNMEDGFFTYKKLGYYQAGPNGDSIPLIPKADLIGYKTRFYLYPKAISIPSNFYAGFDNDEDFTEDLQPAFTMIGTPLLVGTDPAPIVYTSPKFNIASTVPVASINSLTAEYDQPTGSNIKFSIGLFKADGITPVYSSINGFGADGYYLILEDSEDLLKSSGTILPSLPDDDLLAEISSARFRIAMSSTDLNLYEPSVTSITLNYQSESQTNQPVTLSIVPATNNVVKNDAPATYTITVTRVSTFAGTVALSSDIATVFGAGVTANFNPTSITFRADEIIVPGGPVLTKTSLLTVTATDMATATSAKTLTVTGTIVDLGQAGPVATALLTILGESDTVTLNLTIPVEETSPDNFTAPEHPLFTLRLYNTTTGAKVYENLNFHGTISADETQYTKVITATRTEIPADTYSVFVRSDRHLWSKFADTLTINGDNNAYGVTFPILKAGNVSVDNKINMVDFDAIAAHYGETVANLLGDLNNDGTVNMADLNWIINNFALWGTKLPDEIR